MKEMHISTLYLTKGMDHQTATDERLTFVVDITKPQSIHPTVISMDTKAKQLVVSDALVVCNVHGDSLTVDSHDCAHACQDQATLHTEAGQHLHKGHGWCWTL